MILYKHTPFNLSFTRIFSRMTKVADNRPMKPDGSGAIIILGVLLRISDLVSWTT